MKDTTIGAEQIRALLQDGLPDARTEAAVIGERLAWCSALIGIMEEQERLATAESVSDDGRASSTGLRGQAAGRRAVCAEIAAAIRARK